MNKNEWSRAILIYLLAITCSSGAQSAADAKNIPIPYITVSGQRTITLVPSIHGFFESNVDISDLHFQRDGYLFLEYDIASISSADKNPLQPPIYNPIENEIQERVTHLTDVVSSAFPKMTQTPEVLTKIFKLHPYILLTLMERECTLQANIASRSASLDQLIRQAAIKEGMSVRSIESLEESLSPIARLNNKDLIPIIKAVALRIKYKTCSAGISLYIKELNNLLLQGDFRGINASSFYFHQDYYGSTKLNEAYLDPSRNNRIANKIASMIGETDGHGPLIFVIGASHFAGESGIVKYLCDRGLHLSLKISDKAPEGLCVREY